MLKQDRWVGGSGGGNLVRMTHHLSVRKRGTMLYSATKHDSYTTFGNCLRSEDAFVITCVANLMEVKVLYVQQDLRYEMSSYWRFSV
jgi:hypothetical protein